MIHYFSRKLRTKASLTFNLIKTWKQLVNRQWKMLLNPDPIKQAIEACFSYKRGKVVYPPLKLNNSEVQSAICQIH